MLEERVKWHHLLRLVPLVVNNYNLVKLGSRGTGKSHVYKELSPNTNLVSGLLKLIYPYSKFTQKKY